LEKQAVAKHTNQNTPLPIKKRQGKSESEQEQNKLNIDRILINIKLIMDPSFTSPTIMEAAADSAPMPER
jgi:hypothetical protein